MKYFTRPIAQAFVVILLACVISAALVADPALADNSLAPFLGTWVDAENGEVQMVISEDDGLLRISAGDEAYGYNVACVVASAKAACVGDGGKLEGRNFLYESVITFKDDGTAEETWKAFNNENEVKGTTQWRHED